MYRAYRVYSDNIVKACTGKTPQPSPAISGRTPLDFVGTQARVYKLRADCLVRDRHRCVVSRRFDGDEAAIRLRSHDAKDDDGVSLLEEVQFGVLEVAHILPHSLTRCSPGTSQLVSQHLGITGLTRSTNPYLST